LHFKGFGLRESFSEPVAALRRDTTLERIAILGIKHGRRTASPLQGPGGGAELPDTPNA
jgi:hypothetical protein